MARFHLQAKQIMPLPGSMLRNWTTQEEFDEESVAQSALFERAHSHPSYHWRLLELSAPTA